jgi:hypothetical protein
LRPDQCAGLITRVNIVVSLASVQEIVPFLALDYIFTTSAFYGVVSSSGNNQVVSGPCSYVIVSILTEDAIISAATIDCVVAVSSPYCIVARRTVQDFDCRCRSPTRHFVPLFSPQPDKSLPHPRHILAMFAQGEESRRAKNPL